MAIGNSDKIRIAHNSFTRQDPFMVDEETRAAKEDDDVFHFISFVPFKGKLYELDGLQKGPICFGECTAEDWLSKAREQIQKRIEKYAASEIRFNLLAIVGDKIVQMEKEAERLGQLQTWITKKLAGELAENVAAGTGDLGEFKQVSKEIAELVPLAKETLEASLAEMMTSIELQKTKVAEEKQRQINWKLENQRRRHNYVPVIFELLK